MAYGVSLSFSNIRMQDREIATSEGEAVDDCHRCERYIAARGDVIRAEIAKSADEAEVAEQRFERFMSQVHDHHVVQMTLGRYAALMAIINENEEDA